MEKKYDSLERTCSSFSKQLENYEPQDVQFYQTHAECCGENHREKDNVLPVCSCHRTKPNHIPAFWSIINAPRRLSLNLLYIKTFMPITWLWRYSRLRCSVWCHSALAIYFCKYCTCYTVIINCTLKDRKKTAILYSICINIHWFLTEKNFWNTMTQWDIQRKIISKAASCK